MGCDSQAFRACGVTVLQGAEHSPPRCVEQSFCFLRSDPSPPPSQTKSKQTNPHLPTLKLVLNTQPLQVYALSPLSGGSKGQDGAGLSLLCLRNCLLYKSLLLCEYRTNPLLAIDSWPACPGQFLLALFFFSVFRVFFLIALLSSPPLVNFSSRVLMWAQLSPER